jgi:ABC-2 type transport system ATP-binding protein
MTDPILEIRDLRYRYGENRALDGLDLSVDRGEMLGIVGPDGAGKTTLLRALCGLLPTPPDRVRIFGRDPAIDLEQILPHIGYLSQRFSLYGDLTIDENLAFFAEIHQIGDDRRRREELLDFTRLGDFRDRLADRLSGGMKQKLALACTLIHTPRLLLLDEPTTGVDPVSRRDFWKILSSLLHSGMTILMTTPYLDEAERCTRVGLMNRGRLMAVDTPERLAGRVEGQVLEIVCPQVRRAGGLLLRSGLAADVHVLGDRLNAVVGEVASALPRIRARLEEEGIPIENWRTVPPSLEHVFISLMGRGSAGAATSTEMPPA